MKRLIEKTKNRIRAVSDFILEDWVAFLYLILTLIACYMAEPNLYYY